ncbi:MAG: helix-turn-helix domain-containing protein [Chloroflexota bacterium]|nr:helix-turn-helix domain-containing protein [Chloroflexota bacterium]
MENSEKGAPSEVEGEEYVTTAEAAEMLDLGHTTIVRMIHQGQLEARRKTLAPRSPWQVKVSSIEEVQRRRQAAPGSDSSPDT